MKFRTDFTILGAAVAVAVIFPPIVQAAGPSEAKALRKCAGLYLGRWIKPKTQKISTGVTMEVDPTQPLKLRLPSGKGKTTSRVNVSPKEPSPSFIPLITRFEKPMVRRGGKQIIWKGRTTLKTGKRDLQGKILCKVVKRGSKAILNQGNIQVFDRPNDVRIFGRIKAMK